MLVRLLRKSSVFSSGFGERLCGGAGPLEVAKLLVENAIMVRCDGLTKDASWCRVREVRQRLLRGMPMTFGQEMLMKSILMKVRISDMMAVVCPGNERSEF
jgi:hypothetical protein